jgi:hypothetical protein
VHFFFSISCYLYPQLGIKKQRSGGSQFKASLGKQSVRHYLKIHKKKADRMTQVVEHLPTKHVAEYKLQYQKKKEISILVFQTISPRLIKFGGISLRIFLQPQKALNLLFLYISSLPSTLITIKSILWSRHRQSTTQKLRWSISGCDGTPLNPRTWETKAGGSHVQSQPGLHRETLSQKIKSKTKKQTNENWVAQVVECQPSKHKALSSIPQTK